MATPRRNGQLSSCEPCRKSKLRCDHENPHCSRCLRTGQTERCFYHPAPLTQPRVRASRATTRRPKRLRTENQVVFRVDRNIPTATAPTAALASTLSPTADESTLCDQHIAQWTAKKRSNLTPGHLGLAFSEDIFSEYEERVRTHDPANIPVEDSIVGDMPGLSDQVQLGAQVLSLLEKIGWFHDVIELRNQHFPGWVFGRVLTRDLCTSIERMYDAAVRGSRDTHVSLRALSRQIFRNTAGTIEVNSAMEFSEYVSAITPRWDTIGLLFAVLGTATFHTPDDDPIYTHRNPWNIEKSRLRSIATAVGEICCQFCNSAGVTSDPLCWLMTQQTVLLTLMVGDSDYRVWQKLGDISTIIYAFGLHQPSTDNNKPFFLLEMRRRAMVCAYAMDKDLATFVGRPPRICARYCNIEFPLDLTTDEIILPAHEREKAMRKLDADGWNTDGKLTTGVRFRVVLLTSLMRENILELSMCPRTDDLLVRAEKLIQESRQTQQDLPSFMRWVPEEDTTDTNLSAGNESRAFAHVEFTHQEFLLHRILLKRLGIKSQGLLDSSLELLTTMQDIIAQRTREAKLLNMSWDLCFIGLPAAGILTTELLSNQLVSTASTSSPNYSRSAVIQKLSIFLSHLTSFVQPHDANYEIAKQGGIIIRRVLDQVLSPSLGPQEAQPVSEDERSRDLLGDLETDADGNVDFMAWLDSVHWDQDSWVNFT